MGGSRIQTKREVVRCEADMPKGMGEELRMTHMQIPSLSNE